MPFHEIERCKAPHLPVTAKIHSLILPRECEPELVTPAHIVGQEKIVKEQR